MRPPKNKKEHYANVAALGCLLTFGPCEIHHVHGRSVGARLVELGLDGGNGTSLRGFSDALVIPLSPEYHRGKHGVDRIGVDTWEGLYGPQAVFVDEVSDRLGYSLWDLHKAWSPASKVVPRRT